MVRGDPGRDRNPRPAVGSLAHVSDQPDEPADGEVPRDGGPDDADPDAPLRGWIDPDDRLWRHPSEVGAGRGGEADAATGPVTLAPPQRHPFRNVAMILIGVAALVAVVAWIV